MSGAGFSSSEAVAGSASASASAFASDEGPEFAALISMEIGGLEGVSMLESSESESVSGSGALSSGSASVLGSDVDSVSASDTDSDSDSDSDFDCEAEREEVAEVMLELEPSASESGARLSFCAMPRRSTQAWGFSFLWSHRRVSFELQAHGGFLIFDLAVLGHGVPGGGACRAGKMQRTSWQQYPSIGAHASPIPQYP